MAQMVDRRRQEVAGDWARIRVRRNRLKMQRGALRDALDCSRMDLADAGARPTRRIEECRKRAGLSLSDLWLGYLALGGNLAAADLGRILSGNLPVAQGDYDRLAAALNDHYMSLGGARALPYSDGSR
jgi:hypothetical protein